jgi:hypothetical protein
MTQDKENQVTVNKTIVAAIAVVVGIALAGCSTAEDAPAAPQQPVASPDEAVLPSTDWEVTAREIEQNLSGQVPSDLRMTCLQWTMKDAQEREALIREAAAARFDIDAMTDEHKEAFGTGVAIGFMRACD